MASYTVYDAAAKSAIAADMTITYNSGTGEYDIRMVASPSGDTYSVLVLHRWLQDLADEAAYTGDDQLDITFPNPSERKTDQIIELRNGFNIDDTVSRYLFGGSVRQRVGTANEDLYSGLKVLGTVQDGTEPIIVQNGSKLTPFWGSTPTALNGDPAAGTIMRVLIKAKAGGSDIDGGRIRVMAREWGDTYSYFDVTLGEGEAVAALSTSADTNNTSTTTDAATWLTALTITEGYNLIDIDNDGTNEPYYLTVGYGTNNARQTYEALKYIQRRGSTETIFGISGELFLGITHEIDVTSVTGTFQTAEQLSWTGGTGQVLAYDGSGKIWIQLLTGVAPSASDTVTGGTSTATATVSSVSTYAAPAMMAGQFTGSAWIGAYGFAINPTDATKDDSFTDLLGVTHSPPNYQTGTVSNLTPGEFYVLVAPTTSPGSTQIDTSQMTVSGAHANTSTTLTVNAIPADTPASGTLRVYDGTSYRKVSYTSYSGNTFTLSAALGFALSGGEGVFVSYIDKLASATSEGFTTVYVSDRPMVVRVRDGGSTPIKPFETPVTFGSGGFSVTTIVIADV